MSRPEYRPTVPLDLRDYQPPFRLRDHFSVKDMVYLAIIGILIGVTL